MAANYVLLEKITVGAAGASSVTFSGIPQTGYTDLVLRASVRSSNATTQDDMYLRFNADTGNNYSDKAIYSNDGTSATSLSHSGIGFLFTGSIDGASSTASTFTSTDFYIPNYTSANYKSVSQDIVNEHNATAGWTGMFAGLWASSSAITSITLSNSPFAQYSTFSLYGVAKYGVTPTSAPYATGGDTIMTDGTYWYHTFNATGTFTPKKALTADYLVVAGGGGGGGSRAGAVGSGGGGAGGLRCTVTATGGGGSLESALSLGISAYTVTVGAGGAGGVGIDGHGTQGSDSVFSSITSTGGGRGAYYTANGGNGGSGGGGAYNSSGGTGTANQGYNGGSSSSNAEGASGGGGAGAVGVNSTGANGVAGGAGVATSITGSSVTYAGGGGGGSNLGTGGAGGSGGGGAGGNTGAHGVNGTANIGGGGGGSGVVALGTGGTGGSGIVVVRYAV